ncbi:hypothetical protein [Bradyrhizobium sp. Tv2a-2]|uniref:hypothetical protein n=1 Tax=Bradyrhizobium sp. Tv2a-2 TaxID=113395 RepID=UPI00041F57FC|nr:hypothetical protein [Bradyrhizobium sp. Tv2a-2]
MPSKPVVIGLDPSRKLGCAVGPIGGRPSLSTIIIGKDSTPHEDVFGGGAQLLDGLIRKSGAVAVGIERPFYKKGESNYDTTVLMHGLYGALVGVAQLHGLKVMPCAVATWRKVALGTAKLGSRQAGKKAMMDLCAQLGWDADDDNAADAGGVWMWTGAEYAPYGIVG